MITSDTLNLHSDSFEIGLQYYLIANSVPASTSTLSADIYTHSDSTKSAALYLDTELSALLEVSPYVIRVWEGDYLLQQYEQNALTKKGWTGILIGVSEETSFEALLAHLRQRLLVSFSSGRKGILHYSNPNVANYFFGETELHTNTESWLGVIKQVCWYGAENSPNQGVWCKVQNHSDKAEAHTPSWVITPSQEAAFNMQNVDKALATYFTNASLVLKNSHKWTQYRRYFNEAETLGFAELDNIYQYLTLCRSQNSSCDQKEHYSAEKAATSLFERLDIKAIQSVNEAQKLHHIEMLIKKDESYANG